MQMHKCLQNRKMVNQVSFKNLNLSSSLSSSFSSLLETSSLCDVTLVCEDGHQPAHKVVLAAASTFFSSVFTSHPHPHPVIYLRGVKTAMLQCVLQFVYAGTVKVGEEDLSRFLSLAEDIKIAGLVENQEDCGEKQKEIKTVKDYARKERQAGAELCQAQSSFS